LIILGEGGQRQRLSALAERLSISARVALPGFVADPYPWINRAQLLALSSRREGLGNVLVEAMALGVPVVATDCPGGVRGLLADGRLGPLVPVGDHRALATAIRSTLATPANPAALREQAAPYRIGAAAAAYLAFFETLISHPQGASNA
jgi:glycosyltransferase involved in cell wall biosynthesis